MRLGDAEHVLRIAAEQHDALHGLALGLHAHRVLVGAGDNIGAAADDGLERARTGIEVLQFDIDARLVEVAEIFRQHDREEIDLRRRAGDGDSRLVLRGSLSRSERAGHHERGKGGRDAGDRSNTHRKVS